MTTHMDTTQTPETAAPHIPHIHDERVYLAAPAFGGKIDSPFAMCLMQLTQMGFIAQVEFLNGDSLVNRARNKLSAFFMNGRPNQDSEGNPVLVMYDWILFIDTDLIFQPNDIAKLYEYAKANGPGIYCGAYPLKTIKPRVVFNAMPGAQVDADGILRVREAGTGMMLIHREVFAKMKEHFRDEIEYEADSGNLGKARQVEHDFFTVGVRKDPIFGYKRFLSEDWYFCQRWREIGGEVLLQTRLQCQHIGQMTYPASPKDIMEVAAVYQKAIDMAEAQKAAVAVPDQPVVVATEKPVEAAA